MSDDCIKRNRVVLKKEHCSKKEHHTKKAHYYNNDSDNNSDNNDNYKHHRHHQHHHNHTKKYYKTLKLEDISKSSDDILNMNESITNNGCGCGCGNNKITNINSCKCKTNNGNDYVKTNTNLNEQTYCLNKYCYNVTDACIPSKCIDLDCDQILGLLIPIFIMPHTYLGITSPIVPYQTHYLLSIFKSTGLIPLPDGSSCNFFQFNQSLGSEATSISFIPFSDDATSNNDVIMFADSNYNYNVEWTLTTNSDIYTCSKVKLVFPDQRLDTYAGVDIYGRKIHFEYPRKVGEVTCGSFILPGWFNRISVYCDNSQLDMTLKITAINRPCNFPFPYNFGPYCIDNVQIYDIIPKSNGKYKRIVCPKFREFAHVVRQKYLSNVYKKCDITQMQNELQQLSPSVSPFVSTATFLSLRPDLTKLDLGCFKNATVIFLLALLALAAAGFVGNKVIVKNAAKVVSNALKYLINYATTSTTQPQQPITNFGTALFKPIQFDNKDAEVKDFDNIYTSDTCFNCGGIYPYCGILSFTPANFFIMGSTGRYFKLLGGFQYTIQVNIKMNFLRTVYTDPPINGSNLYNLKAYSRWCTNYTNPSFSLVGDGRRLQNINPVQVSPVNNGFTASYFTANTFTENVDDGLYDYTLSLAWIINHDSGYTGSQLSFVVGQGAMVLGYVSRFDGAPRYCAFSVNMDAKAVSFNPTYDPTLPPSNPNSNPLIWHTPSDFTITITQDHPI